MLSMQRPLGRWASVKRISGLYRHLSRLLYRPAMYVHPTYLPISEQKRDALGTVGTRRIGAKIGNRTSCSVQYTSM